MQRHIRNYIEATGKLPNERACERCGSYNNINIHHIINRQKNNPKLDEASNLIALCQDGCHRWIHANNTQENKQMLRELIANR